MKWKCGQFTVALYLPSLIHSVSNWPTSFSEYMQRKKGCWVMFSLGTGSLLLCVGETWGAGWGWAASFYNEEVNRQINLLCPWSFSELDESRSVLRAKAGGNENTHFFQSSHSFQGLQCLIYSKSSCIEKVLWHSNIIMVTVQLTAPLHAHPRKERGLLQWSIWEWGWGEEIQSAFQRWVQLQSWVRKGMNSDWPLICRMTEPQGSERC